MSDTDTIQALAFLLLAVGGILALLPVGECPDCHHCRRARVEAAAICPIHKTTSDRCRGHHLDD